MNTPSYLLEKKNSATERFITITQTIKKHFEEIKEDHNDFFELFTDFNTTSACNNIDSSTRYVYPLNKNINTILFSFKHTPLTTLSTQQSFSQNIRNYMHLLRALIHLSNIDVVHYNIKIENIGIHEDTPIIRHFNNTLWEYRPENTHLPPEVHVITYLMQMKTLGKIVVTKNIINTIINDISMHHPPQFSHIEFESRIKECTSIYSTFIQKDIQDTIEHLTKYMNTWDIYALGLIYAPIFNTQKTIQIDFKNRLTAQQMFDTTLDSPPTKYHTNSNNTKRVK